MKTRLSFILISLMVLGFMVHAQEERKIKFEKTTHEFGKIKKGDPAEYTFKFTNASQELVSLRRVKASCGCTTPSWTKEAIRPGESGEIKVKYNSARIGPFTKTVTVTYDTVEKPLVLYIKGNVEDVPAAEDFVAYRHNMGGLAFDQINQSIGVLDSDKNKELEFKVKNVGPQKITFTGKYDKEMMFEVKPEQMQLLPGERTTIRVNILGGNFITPGTFSKQIVVYTDEAENPGKKLQVNGSLNRVYSEKELASLPNVEFEMTEYDGGTVISGEKVVVAYKFTNTGVDDLVIESVKASCGCTATAPKDKVIPGGGSSEIVATFDSRGRSGPQSKSITVRSNDPDTPTVMLRLKVEVEKDPFHMEDLGPASGSQR